LALTGSSAELVDQVLSVLPTKQVRSIRHELDHPGPTRLSDVDQAQQEVARIAQGVLSQRERTGGPKQRLAFAS
jgi:flagellar motor switch protein FliG